MNTIKTAIQFLLFGLLFVSCNSDEPTPPRPTPCLNSTDSLVITEMIQSMEPKPTKIWWDYKTTGEWCFLARSFSEADNNSFLSVKTMLTEDSTEYRIMAIRTQSGAVSIPSSIENMSELKILLLDIQEFKTPIPPELANCPLEILSIYEKNHYPTEDWPHRNYFFRDISRCKTLRTLQMRGLGIREFPEELFSMIPQLEFLDMEYCGLSGKVPLQTGYFKYCDLCENYFTEMNWDIVLDQFMNIPRLNLNRLKGEIPETVRSLPANRIDELIKNLRYQWDEDGNTTSWPLMYFNSYGRLLN